MARTSPTLTPSHPLIREYHRSLAALRSQGVEHERGLRRPFENLLAETARMQGWQYVAESGAKAGGHLHTARRRRLRPQQLPPRLLGIQGFPRRPGTRDRAQDPPRLPRFQYHLRGHPPRHALPEPRRLHGRPLRFAPACRPALSLLRPRRARHPRVRAGRGGVRQARPRPGPRPGRRRSPKRTSATARFEAAFAGFFSTLPDVAQPQHLARGAVDEMLVQHLLTERLFRTVFDNPDFTRRNAIAAEVEKVIDALMSQSFSRTEFLKCLDPFYLAIENAAAHHCRFQREAALPQHSLRALLPGLLGQGGRHARHRLHAASRSWISCARAWRRCSKREFGLTLSSPGREHPRPLHRHRQFHRQPDARIPQARPAAHVPRAVIRQ